MFVFGRLRLRTVSHGCRAALPGLFRRGAGRSGSVGWADAGCSAAVVSAAGKPAGRHFCSNPPSRPAREVARSVTTRGWEREAPPRPSLQLTSASAAVLQPEVLEPLESPIMPYRPQTSLNDRLETMMECIVKVYATCSQPYYRQPWQNNPARECTGSGFVIQGRRLLTNAHVVADSTYVMVRRLGSAVKYPAKVVVSGHECDLAMLTVEDDDFWAGVGEHNYLDLSDDVPSMQDEVFVVGYPIGGDSVSVTQGVVSRVEPQQYAHGSTVLLAVQIDAAINQGNSGGPAFKGDRVIGMAFQNLVGASNIGFIIPVPIIRHFLQDIQDSENSYTGFCQLGVMTQPTENKFQRKYLGIEDSQEGVIINKVAPLTDAAEKLRVHDVIVSLDGHKIALDGTVAFRDRERITWSYLLSHKFAGDSVKLGVIRDRKHLEIEVTVAPIPQLVPRFLYDRNPSYMIYAGLVFVPLAQPYLHDFGHNWTHSAPRELVELAVNGLRQQPEQEVIILSQVLMHQVNVGYQSICDVQVKKCNGVDLINLKHLASIIDSAVAEGESYLLLEMSDHRTIVIDIPCAESANEEILQRNRIPQARFGV